MARITGESLDNRWTELPESIPLMLTVPEASRITGFSKKHIYASLNNGQLKGIRVGNGWRIPRSALGL